MTPTVSIIIPTYNRVGYLSQAVDSVLAQTLVDWELIVVDDGSTDETSCYLESLADPRIVALGQMNQGESAARNAGIAHARGRYIAFLDDDDLFAPQKLELQAAFLCDHPESISWPSARRSSTARGRSFAAGRPGSINLICRC